MERTTEGSPEAARSQAYFEAKAACVIDAAALAADLRAEDAPRTIVVDVRPREQFEREHLPGAVSAPEGRGLPAGALKGVLYGAGRLSDDVLSAAAELAGHGTTVCELDGGFGAWTAAGLPTEGRMPARTPSGAAQIAASSHHFSPPY